MVVCEADYAAVLAHTEVLRLRLQTPGNKQDNCFPNTLLLE